jgi:hypothetical protein
MGNSDKRSFMPFIDVKSAKKVLLRTAARLGAPHGAYQILEVSAQGDQLRYLIRSLEHEGYKQIVNEVDLGGL